MPLTEVDVMVPEVDALIVQPLHESAGKVIAQLPSLATFVLPEPTAEQVPGPGWGKGISSLTV